MNEYETKDAIIGRLHERCGLCGHCGKADCAGKASNSYLPSILSMEDVIWAISLDKPFEPVSA